jgi:hypothetical protein
MSWRLSNNVAWNTLNYWLCAKPPSPYPNGQSSFQFNYAPPVIMSSTPSLGSTAGNAFMTLSGTSFGVWNVTTVTFTGHDGFFATCTNDATRWNDTYGVCQIPPGVGLGLKVQMNVSAQYSQTSDFSYLPPTITGYSPPTINTDGSTALIISGSNFGPSGYGGTVTVNNFPCVQQSWDHGTVVCLAPLGQGLNFPIVLTTASGVYPNTPTPLLISYTPPNVLSVTPQLGDTMAVYPSTLPTNTPWLLTITGTNFGLSGTVTVGGQQCLLSGSAWGQTVVQCILPAGQGQNIPVILTVGLSGSDQQVAPAVGYDYAPPSITYLTPLALAQGSLLTIQGFSFGDGTATAVQVNGQTCSLQSPGSFSLRRLVCVMPVGTGLLLNATVLVLGRPSNVALVSYAPIVSNVTTASGIYPANSPASNPTILTIKGANFGTTSQSNSTVTLGNDVCKVLTQTPIQMTCILPNGTGTSYPLKVFVLGFSSNIWSLSYAAPTLVNISSIIGPTLGGQVVTLSGSE